MLTEAKTSYKYLQVTKTSTKMMLTIKIPMVAHNKEGREMPVFNGRMNVQRN